MWAKYLSLLDFIPALDEMLGNVQYSWTFEGHMNLSTMKSIRCKYNKKIVKTNIVPGHPCVVLDREGVADIVIYILEIHDAGVVIILTREEGPGEIGGMNIGKGMRMSVPTAKAKIKTTESGIAVVDHHIS